MKEKCSNIAEELITIRDSANRAALAAEVGKFEAAVRQTDITAQRVRDLPRTPWAADALSREEAIEVLEDLTQARNALREGDEEGFAASMRATAISFLEKALDRACRCECSDAQR